MEDAHIVHHYDDDTYIFGVFDGHGAWDWGCQCGWRHVPDPVLSAGGTGGRFGRIGQ